MTIAQMKPLIIIALLVGCADTSHLQRRVEATFHATKAEAKATGQCTAPTDDGRWAAYRCADFEDDRHD